MLYIFCISLEENAKKVVLNKRKNIMRDTFLEQCATLDKDVILDFNNYWKSAELTNVISGLNKECFGIFLLDAQNIRYQLCYFNGVNELEGVVLESDFFDSKRDKLTFYFSDFLSHRYKHLDTISSFNTFQQHLRSLLENLGHLTISSIEIQESIDLFGYPNPSIVGACIIPMIDKPRYYKDYFDNLHLEGLAENEVFIYLMLNKQNNYIKIGKSKKPVFREKTLQAQEPDIELIASWVAPPYVEKEFHNLFKEKRMRGEWFNLKFSDFKIIKKRMDEYKTKK